MPTRSAAYLATQLLPLVEAHDGLIVVVSGESLAESLSHLIGEMVPARVCRHLPAWDCLPYDRASPSAEVMGLRMRAIRELTRAEGRAVLVTTPEAAVQRFPVADKASAPVTITAGASLDRGDLERRLLRFGYTAAAEVAEIGQYAMRGEVVDIFPAGSDPCRIVLDGDVARELHHYDPDTQRRRHGASAVLAVGPVSELVRPAAEDPVPHVPGMEHDLPTTGVKLGTVFTLMPGARACVEADAHVERMFGQVAEAYEARRDVDARAKELAHRALAPAKLYLSAREWDAGVKGRTVAFPTTEPSGPVPRFATAPKVGHAFRTFLREAAAEGARVVLAARGAKALAAMTRQAEHVTGQAPATARNWHEVRAAAPGSVVAMRLSADHGFVDAEGGVTLVASGDLLGRSGAVSRHMLHTPWHGADGEFAFDDAVIHLDHGMGVLKQLEELGSQGPSGEIARLDYANGADLLAPIDELHRIWRYSAAEDIALDRLNGDGWSRRRDKVMAEIGDTAGKLVMLARRRAAEEAPVLVPPRADYERFCDGFAFPLTPDQGHAVTDVLADLASGRVMDRLVVGDVGFGKTEVALRAAAAAVLAGRQVAVIAPTTVLARQHVQVFRRRFEALGIEVAQLSRLATATEARDVKEGLADGRVRVVVGTHAVTGKGVSFAELGLLIVDEEQRFGTADKAKLRALGQGVHTLTLSATPIPRTLQSALVGLQEISVIATAPARRRPVRTFAEPLDLATVRTALTLEHARGGQSFVVVPRIADLDRFAAVLADLVPELGMVIAHGDLDAREIDETMVGFGEGRGDVLLATSIIESGLDVPRANTMIVLDADRFGLGQLHQLRGRVGRGGRQGICYLMTDPDRPVAEPTQRRLATLTRLDRLGSGMAISAQDLDARGGGDLLGDKQAGHEKLIGIGLYQHLLQRAVREARGELVDDWVPTIHGGGDNGAIPRDYIPEPVVRLNLYARLSRIDDTVQLDEMSEELEDRFGPLPAAVQVLLARTRLRVLCRAHAVERVDIGPRAVALTLRPNADPIEIVAHVPDRDHAGLLVKDGRLIYAHDLPDTHAQMHLAARLLGDMH